MTIKCQDGLVPALTVLAAIAALASFACEAGGGSGPVSPPPPVNASASSTSFPTQTATPIPSPTPATPVLEPQIEDRLKALAASEGVPYGGNCGIIGPSSSGLCYHSVTLLGESATLSLGRFGSDYNATMVLRRNSSTGAWEVVSVIQSTARP